VLDWKDFAVDVGSLLVDELVYAAAVINGNDAVANLASESLVAGRLAAAASTAGIISPAPGTGRAIKAIERTTDVIKSAERTAVKVEKTASGARVGDFTNAQRKAAKAENAAANGVQMSCTDCGRGLRNVKSEKGVPTSADQAQVHHDPALNQGGGKDSKAIVLCPACNQDRHKCGPC
jgi:hypothetical protein